MRTRTGMFSRIFRLATAVVLAGGCASQALESAHNASADEGSVTALSAQLVGSACVAQRDACMSDAVTAQTQLGCREQYAACLNVADDDVPQSIVTAVTESTRCEREALACEDAAGPSADAIQLAVCAQQEAYCVAVVLDVDLPGVVPETRACVEGALDCIDASPTLTGSDVLGACATELRACALAAVDAAMPTEVAQAQDDVEACRAQLDACVIAAQTPAEIPSCSEQEARCIAEGLDVPVPENVAPESLVECATTALICTLNATNFDSLDSCNRALDRCITGVVEGEMSCEERWTQCVAADPLLFPFCSLELLGCT